MEKNGWQLYYMHLYAVTSTDTLGAHSSFIFHLETEDTLFIFMWTAFAGKEAMGE